jgi:hypothetical protein
VPRCLYGVISYKFIPVGLTLFLSVVRRLSARSSLKKLSSLESENHIGVGESKLFTPRSKQMGRYKLRS